MSWNLSVHSVKRNRVTFLLLSPPLIANNLREASSKACVRSFVDGDSHIAKVVVCCSLCSDSTRMGICNWCVRAYLKQV